VDRRLPVTGILRDEGFRIERGCAGMPTCYVASWGTGAPVIGIMGDIDGLPETSQTPGVPWEQPLIPGGPGPRRGAQQRAGGGPRRRHRGQAGHERHGLPGEIRVIPGVAEELVASRTYMVNAGMFQDMDAMLSTHISNGMSDDVRASAAPAWSRRCSRSRAAARTARARRGPGAARSTPWS
jgi:aminobenzoyl-glutamate utilization protein B